MRATRAYLAGLGTAGTLVLAASILFVLGSAIVTYNGWPKLGGIGSPATQTLTAHPRPGSHASRGVASITVVKPQSAGATGAAGVPAAVANKRSTLLAQVGHGTATRGSAHHSTSGTISRPVAGRQPTRSSTPTTGGSGSGSTGSGSTGTGTTGSGTTTVTTTPATPVVATPTPVVSTPATPVSTGSGSGSGGGSGSGSGGSGSGSGGSGSGSGGSGSGAGGSGSGSGSGSGASTITTVVKAGSGTVTPPPIVGTHPTGTPVVRVTSQSSGASSSATSTSSSSSSSTSTTSTSTSTTSTPTSTPTNHVPVSIGPVARTGVSGTPTAHIVSGLADAHYSSNASASRACLHGR